VTVLRGRGDTFLAVAQELRVSFLALFFFAARRFFLATRTGRFSTGRFCVLTLTDREGAGVGGLTARFGCLGGVTCFLKLLNRLEGATDRGVLGADRTTFRLGAGGRGAFATTGGARRGTTFGFGGGGGCQTAYTAGFLRICLRLGNVLSAEAICSSKLRSLI